MKKDDEYLKIAQQAIEAQQKQQAIQNEVYKVSGGVTGTPSTQIPSIMDTTSAMTNTDLAKEINNANMVQSKTAQTQEEQSANISKIAKQLESDSDMASQAKQLLNQRNADYTAKTGKTDYSDAVQQTLKQTIPSLAQSTDTGTAGSGYRQYLQEQNSSQDAGTAGSAYRQYLQEQSAAQDTGTAGSAYRQYLNEQNANTANSDALQQIAQQAIQQATGTKSTSTKATTGTTKTTETAKTTAEETKAVKKAQTEATTAQKKAEYAQKKVDTKQTQLEKLQKQLETARKEAKTNGDYSKVNSIGQQITTLKKQLSSATKDATQKQKNAQEKTEAVTTAKSAKTKAQEELNQKLQQNFLTNPLATIKGKSTGTSTTTNTNQTLTTANGTFKNGETLAKANTLVSKAESGKFTKSEKKEAKSVIKEYKQKIKDNDMTDADMEAYSSLQNATSAGSSFMSGIVNAFPTTKAIAEKIGNEFSSIFGSGDTGTKTIENIEKQDKITQNQNPIANVAGNFAGKGAQYALFNQIAGAAGATEAVENALNSKLGLNALSSAGGTVANQASNAAAKNLTGALARVAVGQAADTAFDTIPTLMENAKTGRYDTGDTLQNIKNAADDFSANQLQNLAFNNVSELLPVLSTAVKDKISGADTDAAIAKQAQEQVANTTGINERTGVDNYIIDTRKDLKQMTGSYPTGTKGDIAKTDFQNKLDAYLSAQDYLTEAINSNDEKMVRTAYQKSNEYKEGFLAAAERLKQEYPEAAENVDSWIKSIDEQESAVKAAAAKQQYALADYANVPYPEVGMSYDALNTQKSNAELSAMTEADFNNKKISSSKGGTNLYKTNYDPNKSVSKLQTTLDDYVAKYGIQDDQIEESVNRAKRSINDMAYAVQNRSDVSLRQSIDEYKAAMNDIRKHSAEIIDDFDPNDLGSARSIAASGTQINTWQSDQNLVTDPERELINYKPTFEESLENRTKKAARDAEELEAAKKLAETPLKEDEFAIPMDDETYYAKPWDNSQPETNVLKPKTSNTAKSNVEELLDQNNQLLQKQLAENTADIDSIAESQRKAAEEIGNASSRIPAISDEVEATPRNKTVAASRDDGSIVYNAPKKSESENIPSINQDAKSSAKNANSGNDDAWNQLIREVGGESTGSTGNAAKAAEEVNPIDAVNNLEERMSSRTAKTDDKGYIGKGYTNTIKNSGLATDDQYTKGLAEQTKHFTVSEKESFETGKAIYDRDPQSAIKKYSASMEKSELKNLGSSDIDAMHIAYGKLNQAAKDATDPAEAERLRMQAASIAKNLTDAQHYNAQTLQANSKWRGTTDGMLMSADGTMQRLRDEALSPKQHNQLDEAAQKVSDMLQDMLNGKMDISSTDKEAWEKVKETLDQYSLLKNKFTDKQIQNLTDTVLKDKNWDSVQKVLEMEMTGYNGLSADAIDKATMLMEEAQKYNYGSRKYMEYENQAYQVLAKNIMSQPGYKGKSFGDKVDSWRYLMMLGNPKTMIKNIAGNALFGGVTEIKDNVAAVMETAASRAIKANGDLRTKAVLNPLDSSDKSLIAAAREYGEEYAARALSGNKYTEAGVALDRVLDTWGNSKAGRAIQWLSDKTTDILDSSDQKAMLDKYQNALARFIKANGYDTSIFSDTSEDAVNFLAQASDYAVHAAEEAAFHQSDDWSNHLSKSITNWKSSDQKLASTFGKAVDAALPFKKTPANVLRSCVEYSPFEYLTAMGETRKLVRGEISSTKYIDELAKATTGTAMYAMGALLAHEGIIRIGLNKGDNETNTDTRTGNQNGALYIGKQSFDLSDLAPAAYPLIAGATFKESFDNDDSFFNALVNGIKSSGESLIDTTMLMGINDIFESIRYADQEQSGIASAAASVAESYAGQFLPTLGRGTNATADPTSYSTYSSETGTKKQIESTGKYLETKVPGLQKLGEWADNNDIPVLKNLKLEPAVDAWGNEKKQNSAGVDAYTDNAAANMAGRAIANFATPTKTSADKSEDIDNAIRDLKKSVTSDGTLSAEDADELFPYTATSEAKINGTKLSESDWTEYQKSKGKTSKELAETLLTSGQYDDLSDADKAEILPQLYKFSKAYTASEYGGTISSSNAKLVSAYEEGGASGLIDYITDKSEKSDFNAQVAASNSDGKSTIDNVVDYLNAVKKQDSDKAAELAEQASEYQNGTYTLKDGKYVYQNKNTTKTGTGNTVTIPGPEDVGLQKSSTTTSSTTSTKSTTKEAPDMSAYKAAHAKEWAIYSKDSTVGKSGTNYADSSRYQRVKGLSDVDGIETNGVGYEKAIKAIDTDGNGSMNKSEITSWINSMAEQNGWDQDTKRSVYSAFAPKNWKNPY